MKDQKQKKAETFSSAKETLPPHLLDKVRPLVAIEKNEFHQVNQEDFEANSQDDYIRKNFEFWNESHTKFQDDKKEPFKEANYDYVRLLPGQIVVWKRAADFFRFFQQEEKKTSFFQNEAPDY